MIPVILEHIKDENNVIKTFYFRPEKPVDYVAGQFTELYLPHNNPDNRGQKRWFTLSSAPHQDLLSITTKFALKPSSFKQALLALQPGDKLEIAEPMGDFILPKDTTRDIVFIAGGIGVTPMHSMVADQRAKQEKRSIHLIYTVNHQDEFVFLDELKRGIEKLDLIAANHDASWTGLSGSLSANRILELHPPQENSLYFLSGPEPMVEAITKDVWDKGVSKHHIVTDYFPGYSSF